MPHANRRIVTIGLLALAAAAAAAPPATAPAPLTFDDKGAHVGDQLPDLPLVTLDNEPIHLHDHINGPLTVIVTSSFTCPKSRSNYPALADLAQQYKDKVNFVILYVIEAHPAGDPSPYRNGAEDITPENTRDGILRRQPTTLDKRLTLANDFVARMQGDAGPHVRIPLMVDTMDNWAWKSCGAGPNMAIVVDASRTVLARQGWFDAAALMPVLDKALRGARSAPAAMAPDGASAALFKTMVERKDIETDSPWAIRALLDEKGAAKLSALLTQYPALATAVSSYLPRGDSGGETLLQSAATGNHPAAVKLLLEHGADASQSTPFRPPPLDLAAEKGNDDVIRLLLPKIKDINARYHNGPTALETALLNEKISTSELLIAAGARETFVTQVARGNAAAVKAALAQDDSRAVRSDALAYAAANGRADMIRLLDAATNHTLMRATHDHEAVPAAIEHNHAEALAALLAIGADPNVSVYFRGSALHMAVAQKSAALVQLLLDAHAKPNVSDMSGHTPLHDAAVFGDVAAINLLLAHGADVNAQSGDTSYPCGPGGPTATLETPLHLAAENGNAAAVNSLLAGHADVAIQDARRCNALHHALMPASAKKEIIQALLAAQTPLAAEDINGKSPLDYAEKLGKPEITALLTAAGAKKGGGQKQPPLERPTGSIKP